MKSTKYLLIILTALCSIFIVYHLKANGNLLSNIPLITKEISLSKCEQGADFLKYISVSPDNTKIAYKEYVESGRRLSINGVPGKIYDRKYFTSIDYIFSPDSKHLAYVAGTLDKKNFVVLDGEEGPDGFSGIGDPMFSPDSKQIAYQAWDSNSKKEVVFLNQEKIGEYERIAGMIDLRFFVFSSDGKRMGFIGGNGNKELAVVDGKEGKYYNYVGGLMFSRDSQHFMYNASFGNKRFIVKDATEIAESNNLETAIFNPDFSRTACIYKEGDKKYVVVDGKPGKQYDNITELKFSPSGKRFAYAAWDDLERTMYVVLDDQEQKVYQWVKDIIFSPDSEHIAYSAGIKGKNERCIVVDANEGKKYVLELTKPNYNVSPPVFSPDSKHFGYVVEIGNQSWMVVDEVEGRHYDKIRKESPDGFNSKWDKSFTFGPDGKVAYWAQKGSKWLVVVNGVESQSYDEYLENGKILFEGPNQLSFVALRDKEIFRVEIEIKKN